MFNKKYYNTKSRQKTRHIIRHATKVHITREVVKEKIKYINPLEL